jgi:hypothetical protein
VKAWVVSLDMQFMMQTAVESRERPDEVSGTPCGHIGVRPGSGQGIAARIHLGGRAILGHTHIADGVASGPAGRAN